MAAHEMPARTNWRRRNGGVRFGGRDNRRRRKDGAEMAECRNGGQKQKEKKKGENINKTFQGKSTKYNENPDLVGMAKVCFSTDRTRARQQAAADETQRARPGPAPPETGYRGKSDIMDSLIMYAIVDFITNYDQNPQLRTLLMNP